MNDAPRGLRCPKCGRTHFHTTHTEPLRDGRIRRRRRCKECDHRIVTFEGTRAALWKAGLARIA
jgi:transcriptional regulator NrdR family protein